MSHLLGLEGPNDHYSMSGYRNFQFFEGTIFDEGDIGSPTESYHIISGTHVYEREFTTSKVLVNPTYSSYNINLGGTYKTINGNTVSTITVPPHTGMILFK
jgi:hypothetical protein